MPGWAREQRDGDAHAHKFWGFGEGKGVTMLGFGFLFPLTLFFYTDQGDPHSRGSHCLC